MKVRKQNIFNTTWAVIKFILWWILVFICAFVLLFVPTGNGSVKYLRFFMRGFAFMTGVKFRIHGKLTTKRPLLCVCNHISVFEFASMPIAFGASFFGKKEISQWPLVGWIAKKFGVVFVDRRPSHAIEAISDMTHQLRNASYPVTIFPEGTTTNGAYVREFKSAMFNLVDAVPDLTIQPMVITYRTRRNKCVNDCVLANDYAYFDNVKQTAGPKCERERSAFGQIFHIAQLGGMTVHITVLPPVPVAGRDRKEIAKMLHEIVSNKYMEIKDKEITR